MNDPRYWWVNQNQTHRHEITGGYLWSPKLKGNGHRNPFYESMREVRPGDVVFSFFDAAVQHIGIATSYCHDSPRPEEFGATGERWSDLGYRVSTVFQAVPKPFRPKAHIDELRSLLPEKYAPLTPQGDGLQSVYLTSVPEEMAHALLSLAGTTTAAIDLQRREALSEATDVEGVAVRSAVEDKLAERIAAQPMPPTKRQAIIQARRGQGLFRANVLRVERGCRITGITNPTHLIASHIKPWRACESPAEQLDGENGLLLTPNVDHLFDHGFISFSDEGDIIVSPTVEATELRELGVDPAKRVGLFSPNQRTYLAFHRAAVLKKRQ